MIHRKKSIIAVLILVASVAVALHFPGNTREHFHHFAQGRAPSVEHQLTVLTEHLVLTVDQQTKTKPVLQELHDAMQEAAHDENMSREARQEKMRTLLERTDWQIRQFLNDDQQKKLDFLEHDPELHRKLMGR